MLCRRSKVKPAMNNVLKADNKKRKPQDTSNVTTAANKKKRRYQIKNQWLSIIDKPMVATCSIVPAPEDPGSTASTSRHSTQPELVGGSHFRFQNFLVTPNNAKHSPLPKLSWADSHEVWQVMLEKEHSYTKDPCMLDRHPSLQSKMRAILLDWLIEVCEVYKLHRETYYLSLDFIDRYLSKEKCVIKHQLQLIGITSLFIAAKLEEIYPPKLSDFAYVTDGACSDAEILNQELVMLKVLSWDLSPMTVTAWLNVYLQLVNVDKIAEDGFDFPQYSSNVYIQIARLIDLCMLDISCLRFTSSVIASSALYHMASKSVALAVSGLSMTDLLPCIQWMNPYAITLREAGPVELKFFPMVHIDDSHNVQTHAVDLDLLEKAHLKEAELKSTMQYDTESCSEAVLLTPPQSDKKEVSTDALMSLLSTPDRSLSEVTSTSSSSP
ncbi:G1/S-specific cyclin-E isoform X1 [Octopus sinensis]|uniref:G1/S-specific cyclin-E isoform X1 n=1 Tax=Octopus sinensis TaxID=2607531 RepID=A0A6P7SBD9_9MOLL|nr:G1/S-specific cyclin-E isoform X1 [Octopus sinensis]